MRVSLPYSKNRRYLTGIDWTIGALDAMTRRATGGSNTFQIVLEIKGPLEPARFQEVIAAFVRQFPVLGGRPSRDWTLAPYWKMPRPGSRVPVSVEFTQVEGQDSAALLEESANRCLPDRQSHVAFRVFHVNVSHHFIAVQFDHRLFDATGAETFLGLLHRWAIGEDCSAQIRQISLKEPAHLCDWMKKFEAGKLLVRLLRKFAESPLAVLPRPAALKGRRTRFSIMEFSAEETKAISMRASQEAGFLMFMPYTLAVSLEALAPAFARRGTGGGDYLVSVSVDLRPPEAAPACMFFNHVSFIFFQIPAAILPDRKALLKALRLQMYEQIQCGFPKALYESSMVMRILPLSVLSRLMLKPLRGEFASLGFTCVGKSGYAFDRFMGAELVNLIHMPLVPVPPGIGFFISQSGPKMNAVLSFVEGMLTDEEARRFQDDVRRLL
ncbi:MAG: hypothetical protein WCO42_01490 [bacterium]